MSNEDIITPLRNEIRAINTEIQIGIGQLAAAAETLRGALQRQEAVSAGAQAGNELLYALHLLEMIAAPFDGTIDEAADAAQRAANYNTSYINRAIPPP